MKALVVTDIQRDFCPGGALPVPGADEIVPVVNKLMAQADFVIVTREVHPPDHCSFALMHPGKSVRDTVTVKGQAVKLWPTHCVEGTPGAAFHPDLNEERFNVVLRKGAVKDEEQFSPLGPQISPFFQALTIKEEIYVCGLATDYCVRAILLDLAALGLKTYLIEDACRGIDPETTQAAIDEMVSMGIEVVSSTSL